MFLQPAVSMTESRTDSDDAALVKRTSDAGTRPRCLLLHAPPRTARTGTVLVLTFSWCVYLSPKV